jgi:hypothetical protein
MISLALTVTAFVVGTLIPAYLALYLVSNLRSIKTRLIAAVAFGLSFWFFFDTMGDAGDLSVNSSLYPFSDFGGWPHFAVILVFLGGIAALASFDYIAVPPERAGSSLTSGNSNRMNALLLLIPLGAVAVMGIHGLGEGWDFGTVAASPTTNDLVTAFGGTGPGALNPLISYPIHKFLEASIIAALYTAYVKRNNFAQKKSWHIPILGLLFGLPSVIGTFLGFYLTANTTFFFDTTYFYAFGVTAGIYSALRLVEPINSKFQAGSGHPMYLGGKVFIAIGLGFFLLYFAALLH